MNPISFLETYAAEYDIVFMDVEMPLMDGFETAERMRKVDETTILIFVTRMAQLAINGYVVGAMDYIIKPITYSHFTMKFRRAVEKVAAKGKRDYVIKNVNTVIKVDKSDIRYVETTGRKCSFHTTQGIFESYISLYKVKEELEKYGFSQCNNYTLVNLA